MVNKYDETETMGWYSIKCIISKLNPLVRPLLNTTFDFDNNWTYSIMNDNQCEKRQLDADTGSLNEWVNAGRYNYKA